MNTEYQVVDTIKYAVRGELQKKLKLLEVGQSLFVGSMDVIGKPMAFRSRVYNAATDLFIKVSVRKAETFGFYITRVL